MKLNCQQALLAGALLVLTSDATAKAGDKPEAAPVGVVKATVFLGEFE